LAQGRGLSGGSLRRLSAGRAKCFPDALNFSISSKLSKFMHPARGTSQFAVAQFGFDAHQARYRTRQNYSTAQCVRFAPSIAITTTCDSGTSFWHGARSKFLRYSVGTSSAPDPAWVLDCVCGVNNVTYGRLRRAANALSKVASFPSMVWPSRYWTVCINSMWVHRYRS
jgi:hypothetical protein